MEDSNMRLKLQLLAMYPTLLLEDSNSNKFYEHR